LKAGVTPTGVGVGSSPLRQVSDSPDGILDALNQVRKDVSVVQCEADGSFGITFDRNPPNAVALLPGLYPERLGERAFCETHGCRFPYVVGEMARGLTSVEMVVAAVRGGLMAFFGSAGLSPPRIEDAIGRIRKGVGNGSNSWGMNLIHNIHDPDMEDQLVEMFLRTGLTRVSASAFMQLTPAVVRYACSGLARSPDGSIQRRNHLFAKISRPETARLFMSPPPEAMLRDLVGAGRLTEAEAEMARTLPLAEDVTAEADSGGHTDNRPLTALLPTIAALRDDLCQRYGYARSIRVGAAGGLGTPGAVSAAFAMGAAYALTGSINQAAIESGLSEDGRRMLASADMADMVMTPSADMFELGVKVQVLKRGTFFHARAAKLFELYRSYDGLEAIPTDERKTLEAEVFKTSLDEIWTETRDFFLQRDPGQVTRAETDPKYRMALVFRWYLFHGVMWAMDGVDDRRTDYQIWCGPAMGAFNAWVAGSFLEPIEARCVVQIALNLLEGAATIARAGQLRALGVAVPNAAFHFRPRRLKTSE
jgi:trans-AT polyketide synthase, acyltransferase and oxidoreductase domains